MNSTLLILLLEPLGQLTDKSRQVQGESVRKSEWIMTDPDLLACTLGKK